MLMPSKLVLNQHRFELARSSQPMRNLMSSFLFNTSEMMQSERYDSLSHSVDSAC